jgi:myo-inositol-1(or 4)-monophosphatase
MEKKACLAVNKYSLFYLYLSYMCNEALDTSLVDRAIVFAVKAHAGTERRGKGIPYIVHPLEAMTIVSTITADPELLAAAVLHDTVEDTDVTIGDLRAAFGERVAALVASESDSFTDDTGRILDWKERKVLALRRLTAATRDEKIVTLGDKLSNMRAIARDYAALGEDFWLRFHVKDKASHAWRYRALAEALGELADTAAYQEFVRLINQVFGA